MPVFLDHCIGSPSVVVDQWAVSDEGRSFYLRKIEGMLEIQEPEQAILDIWGLACLLPSTADEDWRPSHDCYLKDYDWLLRGGELKNRRAVCQRMILSISRVAGKRVPMEFYSLLNFDITQLPLDWKDGFSDQYWKAKLDGKLTHRNALTEVQERYEEYERQYALSTYRIALQSLA
jgi:hypothetical protein